MRTSFVKVWFSPLADERGVCR